jgi:hypothetical protein
VFRWKPADISDETIAFYPRTLPIESFGLDSGLASVRAEYGYPKGSLYYEYLSDGLVVRVPGYRSRGPGSMSSATRFSKK